MAILQSCAAAVFLLLLAPLLSAEVTLASFPTGSERRARLQFYIHYKISSPNATALKVAAEPSAAHPSATGPNFRGIYVIDDLITEGPDPTSQPMGRARGFYTVSSVDGSELHFSMQAGFSTGAYKGSSITIMGRDRILEEVRELQVAGGSGIFRLARGFVFVKTHTLDIPSGDAILHVDAYVLHH